MRQLAADLRATGELRTDLDDDTVADLIWSTNAVEHYQILERRGWTAERYGSVLLDLWSHALLARCAPGIPAAGQAGRAAGQST